MNEIKLHKEIALGKKAQQAYDSYLKDYFARRREGLFSNFIEAQMDDDQIIGLKRVTDALLALETSVQTDIQNGQLAEAELSQSKTEKVM